MLETVRQPAPPEAAAPPRAARPGRRGAPPRRRGPSTSHIAIIACMTTGIAVLVLMLAQLGWSALVLGGVAPGSVAVTHVLSGSARVLLGAALTVLVLDRMFGCRPPWRLALRAHLLGVLVTKASLLAAPVPVLALVVLFVGLAIPAIVVLVRAGR